MARGAISRRYHKYLLDAEDEGAEKAYEYLKARGLKDESIDAFSLGYVLDPVPQHSMFVGWLSIPYFAAAGDERFIRFRRLDEETGGKYKQPYGTRLSIYNIVDTEAEHVYITEGEFDTIILTQCGMASTALPGTNSWRDYYRWLYREADLVTVILDGDDEGVQASMEVARSVASLGVDVRNLTDALPFGKDINDLYLEDEEGLKELLNV